jgi:hypothetical protein
LPDIVRASRKALVSKNIHCAARRAAQADVKGRLGSRQLRPMPASGRQ